MVRSVPFVQLDVFTNRRFAGNPLAVFPDARGLSSREMQLLAREKNLSETTFVLPPRDRKAQYRMRIFTPVQELPYAGHPSVGTAWHLAATGKVPLKGTRTRIFQETLAGVLPIDLEVDAAGRLVRVFTTQARPTFGPPVRDRARIAKALGLRDSDLHPDLPVQKVSTGLPWLLVPVRDDAALDRVRPDLSAFHGRGAVYANVYPFTLKPRASGSASEGRGLPMREFEDPVTGSASGCLGAYIAQHRLLPSKAQRLSYVHAQGRHLGRPGKVFVEVGLAADGTPQEVRVGGAAVEVLTGEATLP